MPPRVNQWVAFEPSTAGAWVRIVPDHDATKVTADFHFSNADDRSPKAAPIFDGVASAIAQDYSGGILLTSPASQAGLYLGTLIGINLLSSGIASAAAGFTLRRSPS